MTTHDDPSRERVERFLEKRSLDVERAELLTGDASNRIYFRLRRASGGAWILALMPEPFRAEDDPFLDARKLLAELRVRVPEVVEAAGDEGVLVLEDLGDGLLQEAVESCSSEEKEAHYREAVDILVRLQRGAARLEPASFLALRTAFDAEKFFAELEFFRVHCLSGLRGGTPGASDREALDESFREIASELAAQPFALCHRDYHSRNLLCLEEGLAVIDFQDARMGPRCYDLASLLNDSYAAHPPELVEEMKRRFAREAPADVDAEYDLAALQRNLKALGTFGFQITQRGNEVYRQYVQPTLGLVRENLERHRRWDRLRRALAGSFPELH